MWASGPHLVLSLSEQKRQEPGQCFGGEQGWGFKTVGSLLDPPSHQPLSLLVLVDQGGGRPSAPSWIVGRVAALLLDTCPWYLLSLAGTCSFSGLKSWTILKPQDLVTCTEHLGRDFAG